MSLLSTIARCIHSTFLPLGFLPSFHLSSLCPLSLHPHITRRTAPQDNRKRTRSGLDLGTHSHSPMANHLDILAPEGREYLIEIAKRIDHAQQHHHYQSSSPGMSFTTGLLLGQLSVVLLVIVCFKYLLLEDVRYGRKVGSNLSERAIDRSCGKIQAPTREPDMILVSVINPSFSEHSRAHSPTEASPSQHHQQNRRCHRPQPFSTKQYMMSMITLRNHWTG